MTNSKKPRKIPKYNNQLKYTAEELAIYDRGYKHGYEVGWTVHMEQERERAEIQEDLDNGFLVVENDEYVSKQPNATTYKAYQVEELWGQLAEMATRRTTRRIKTKS